MEDHHAYPAADITPLTFREAVARRPAMFFGNHPAEDWPLVIAAWTVIDILRYVTTPESRAMVTLHRDGDLSAEVTNARLSWPVNTERRPVEDLIRQRMWWRELSCSMAVTVLRDGTQPEGAEIVRGELVWDNLDIAVRLTLDDEFLDVSPQSWWRDGVARLRVIFGSSDSLRLQPGWRLLVTDEAAGVEASIG